MMSVQTRFKYISMKKILSLAALALGVSALVNGLFSTSAYAQAVTGDVEIKAVLPDIVFLETYKDITFNFNVADLTPDTTGLIQTENGDVAAGGTIVNPLLSATTTTAGDKLFSDVLVYRTWGLGGPGGRITHSASLTDPTLEHSSIATSTIGLAAAKTSVTEDAPGITGTPLEGKMDFTFNFSSTTAAGDYGGATLQVSAEGV
jgi:hypothetical protein